MLLEFGALVAIVTQKVSFLGAFLAGLITFLTPCVLPLIPVWMALATGRQFSKAPGATNSANAATSPFQALWPTLFFILGFSLVFIGLGAAASALGSILADNQDILRLIGGTAIILFGLTLLGLKLPPFSWLEGRRLALPERAGFLGSFLVGLTFAAGWTPCVGPVLGSILAMATLQRSLTLGAQLLAVYCLGLALPFVVIALLWGRILPKLKGWGRFSAWLSRILGLLMVALGLLLLFDKLYILSFNYPY
ncbi:MAG: cytochrome c biogenesis protein CcdA [Deltaproteobacteria bacterium]|jgi:cytochrome c-type biogenesis protein|nr:cytochrome c biogenesis protein CcdA [Deltaproteobacteria bacterium]